MNCKQVSTRLNDYVDGELSGYEMRAVRSHLDDCAVCHQELVDLRALKAAVHEVPVFEPTPEFEEQLISAVFAHEEPRARRRLTLVWAFGVTFLVAFAGASAWLRASRAEDLEAGERMAQSRFELARDQAYTEGADPFYGPTAVLTTSHGR